MIIIVGRIQRCWKRLLLLDESRKELLRRLWDAKKKELIHRYRKLSVKHKSIATKLTLVNSHKRDLIIKNYYNDFKNRYLSDMRMWLFGEKKEKAEDIFNNELAKAEDSGKLGTRFSTLSLSRSNEIIIRFSKRALTLNERNKELTGSQKPQFNYKPNKELLIKIILQAISN